MKTLLYTLSFVLVSTWGVAQNAANDYFNINQKARKYPGFGVANYQGLFSGGHPYVSPPAGVRVLSRGFENI